MSWWRTFGGVFGGGTLQNPDKGIQQSGPAGGRSDANVVVTDERAMMQSTVFRCVSLTVQSGATMPLGFFTRTSDGREPLATDHYLCQLLKFKPNNFMTAKQFRQAMWMQRVLWGNAYAKIKWLGKRPVSLVPLKPEFMSVERGDSGLLYRYSTQDGVKEYGHKDILHWKGFSSDGIMGVSAIAFARQTLGLSVSADRSASRAVNGNASAVLELEEIPTPAQKKQLRDQYGAGDATSEFRNDGGLMIVPGGMKYRAISIPPDDLQLLESRQWQVPEICRFFGVPAVMVDGSLTTNAAFPASFEQQKQYFLDFTLKAYLEEFEDVVPDVLLLGTEKQTVFAEHNVEGFLRGDSAARANFHSQALQNGWKTINEVRKVENLPRSDDPEADKLRVQLNIAPIDEPTGEPNAVQN